MSKQLRNGNKGRPPNRVDRQKMVLCLYAVQRRIAALSHEEYELRQLIRSDYWTVRDVTDVLAFQETYLKKTK